MKNVVVPLLLVPVLTLAAFLGLALLSFVELRGKDASHVSLVSPGALPVATRYGAESEALAEIRREERTDLTAGKIVQILRSEEGGKLPPPERAAAWLRALLTTSPGASDEMIPGLLSLWKSPATGKDPKRDQVVEEILTLACLTAREDDLGEEVRGSLLDALRQAIARRRPVAGALLVLLSKVGTAQDAVALRELASPAVPRQMRTQVEKVIASLERRELERAE